MCSTCGCDQPGGATITRVHTEKDQFVPVIPGSLMNHQHHHNHEVLDEVNQRVIQLEQDILSKNNSKADHNRYHFEESGILAINLVSSPGSGKTSLLETTLHDIHADVKMYVIEGDQQTLNDANRIAATGCEVVQINTGKGCHLDADMVHRALHQLDPRERSIVFIENVGNLVCPALFDLGERARVAIISVTEGDDKPLKYPDMFESSHLVIINKVDLLPYVKFSVDKVKENALRINPRLEFIELSATSGEGMRTWYAWLERQRELLMRKKTVHV
jgi:hydrogenase nickel incorporation protein HypB